MSAAVGRVEASAWLRWATIPGLIALVVLVVLALGAEDRETFEERTAAGGDLAGDTGATPGDGTIPPYSLGIPSDLDGVTISTIPPQLPTAGQGDPGPSTQDVTGNVEIECAGGGSGAGGPGGDCVTVMTLETPHGIYELRSDGSTTTITCIGGNWETVTLEPDPTGRIEGFRLADGNLERLTASDELVPGDVAVFPVGEGNVMVVAPDGSTTVLVPSADGVVVYDTTGTETAIGPGEVADLGGGLWLDAANDAASPATDTPEPAEPQSLDDAGDPDASSDPDAGEPDEVSDSDASDPDDAAADDQAADAEDGRSLWPYLAAAVAIVAAAAGAIWWIRRKEEAPEVVAPIVEPVATDWWAEFDAFLQSLRDMPDTAAAVRHAFAYASGGPGRLPARGDDTPLEWHATVTATDPDLAEPLATLVMRYVTVHYGDVTPSPTERDEAVDALGRLVQAAVRQPAGADT